MHHFIRRCKSRIVTIDVLVIADAAIRRCKSRIAFINVLIIADAAIHNEIQI